MLNHDPHDSHQGGNLSLNELAEVSPPAGVPDNATQVMKTQLQPAVHQLQ